MHHRRSVLRYSLALALSVCSFLPVAAAEAQDPVTLYQTGVTHQQYALYAPSVGEHQNRLKLAAEQFQAAIKLRPDYFDAIIHLANVQSELGEYAESLRNLETALKLPDISAVDSAQTQQAIAYVKSRLETGEQTALEMKPPSGQSESNAEEAPVAVEAVQQQPTPTAADDVNSGAPPDSIAYTRFVDPSERAFSVEVPAGWSAEGGLTRVSAIDCRPWVRVTSPDKLICAFVGDGEICPSTMPTAQLSSLGFGIGAKYMGGQILPYIPARNFAEKYARLKLKPYMQNIEIVDEGNHPDIAQIVNGSVQCTKSECASIKLTGNVGNLPAVGYYLAATKATVMSGTGMWWVTLIAGEISSARQEGAGLAVLLRMLQSFQYDPAWQKQSLATTAAVSANYRANANIVSKSISDRYWNQQAFNDRMNQSYWKQQAVNDRAANNFSDYIRGQQTVADPQTGAQYKVDQASQHWIDPAGNITGTDNTFTPAPGWRQLENAPSP
jgi:hypothetical protein